MSRRSIESGNTLTNELVAVVCTETGQAREAVLAIVRPIARYLDREYGGTTVYKKKCDRSDEELLDNVLRDIKNHVPKKVICRIHRISQSKLYRLLNDGAPAAPTQGNKGNGSAHADRIGQKP